jgi:hypothetical protein
MFSAVVSFSLLSYLAQIASPLSIAPTFRSNTVLQPYGWTEIWGWTTEKDVTINVFLE